MSRLMKHPFDHSEGDSNFRITEKRSASTQIASSVTVTPFSLHQATQLARNLSSFGWRIVCRNFVAPTARPQ
ncbi:hypothetical protein F444_06962, partial [Phytophthora nicotianae P1976]